MLPIATFFHYAHKEYLTQIIKNKNLPFLKTKNQNVLNVQIKNRWTQFADEKKTIFVILYVYVLTRTNNTTLKTQKH